MEETKEETKFLSHLGIRAECLRMAYETAHKIGHFKNTSTYTSIDGSFEDDLKEVFEIADKNLDYVLNKHKGNGDGPL